MALHFPTFGIQKVQVFVSYSQLQYHSAPLPAVAAICHRKNRSIIGLHTGKKKIYESKLNALASVSYNSIHIPVLSKMLKYVSRRNS